MYRRRQTGMQSLLPNDIKNQGLDGWRPPVLVTRAFTDRQKSHLLVLYQSSWAVSQTTLLAPMIGEGHTPSERTFPSVEHSTSSPPEVNEI